MHTNNILTIEGALGLTPEQLALLRSLGVYPPMAGAETPDTTGDDDSGDDEGSGEGTGDSGGSGSESTGSGEGGGDDDADDEDVLEISRRDYNRMRQIAKEHDALEARRRKDEKDRKEKEQREQGRFEEMLKEKDDERATTEAERDEARLELYNHKRTLRVEKAAKLLGFKDPDDAIRFITEEDSEDDAATERALRKLAKRKPYLVDQRRSTGVPVGGGNGSVTLTLDQVKNMTQDEINANWEAVQQAMAAGEG